MLKKNFLSRITVMVLAMSMFFSVTQIPVAASPANNTFIYAIEGDPGSDINTVSTSGRFDLMVERMVYSTLYNYYGEGDITYLLAESIDVSEDMLTITAHLRKDVVWQDGVPFTADDVIFTYEMIMNFDYANGYDSLVINGEKTKLTKLDDYTVEFRVPSLYAGIIESLTAEHYIMPKHIYEGDETLDNNPKNATPVGIGPYKLVDYVAGQYVKFEANETYFLGKPEIETVIFQIISNIDSAMLALKKGEINAMVLLNSNAANFEKSNVTIHAYPEDRVGYLSFELASDRVQDVNLRKACFFALNRTEMNIGAYLSDDFYTNAYSFLPEAALYYTADVEKYEQDLKKAKEYLAKCAKIPTLRLAYSANNLQQEIQAMVIQQNLKAIGVDVELIVMESNALVAKMQNPENKDYDMYLGGYIMGVDPSLYATLFITGSASNYSHMSDKELDDLFTAGSIEIDSTKRREIYENAQKRLTDLAVQFPIVTNKRLLGITNDVGGIEEARFVPIYTFENIGKLYFNK